MSTVCLHIDGLTFTSLFTLQTKSGTSAVCTPCGKLAPDILLYTRKPSASGHGLFRGKTF